MDTWDSPYKEIPQATPKYLSSATRPTADDSPGMPCRFTTAEKEKHCVIPSSQFSIHLLTPPFSTMPLGPTLDELKFLILLIPYGGDYILMTVTLNAINCILYVPLKLLIYVVCCIAMYPKSLKQHQISHADRGSVMEAIVDHLIQKLRVLNRDALYNLPVPFLAILVFYLELMVLNAPCRVAITATNLKRQWAYTSRMFIHLALKIANPLHAQFKPFLTPTIHAILLLYCSHLKLQSTTQYE